MATINHFVSTNNFIMYDGARFLLGSKVLKLAAHFFWRWWEGGFLEENSSLLASLMRARALFSTIALFYVSFAFVPLDCK